jgi:hypothetical protein
VPVPDIRHASLKQKLNAIFLLGAAGTMLANDFDELVERGRSHTLLRLQ